MSELTPEELQRAETLRQGFLELQEQDPGFLEKSAKTVGAVASDIGTGISEAPGQAVRGVAEAAGAAPR